MALYKVLHFFTMDQLQRGYKIWKRFVRNQRSHRLFYKGFRFKKSYGFKHYSFSSFISDYKKIEVKKHLTIPQAAKYLRVSRQTIYNMIARKDLHPVKFGRRKKAIRKSELNQFIIT